MGGFQGVGCILLLPEKEIHGADQEEEADRVIPLELLGAKKDQRECDKDHERDHLLDHFHLEQGEWAAVVLMPEPIGGHLQAVFKKGNAPTDQDHSKESQIFKTLHALEFQVPIPSEGHEGIGGNEEQDGIDSTHKPE